MSALSNALEKLGRASIARPIVLGVTLWLTYDAYQWAAVFAETSARTGLEVTAIVAAVIAPISALQAFVFKQYNDSCKVEQ